MFVTHLSLLLWGDASPCNPAPPVYIRAGRDLSNISTSKAIQTTQQDIWYYATRDPNLSKSLCCLHHRVLDLADCPRSSIYIKVSLGRCDDKTLTYELWFRVWSCFYMLEVLAGWCGLVWVGRLGLIYRGGCVIMPAYVNDFASEWFVAITVNKKVTISINKNWPSRLIEGIDRGGFSMFPPPRQF